MSSIQNTLSLRAAAVRPSFASKITDVGLVDELSRYAALAEVAKELARGSMSGEQPEQVTDHARADIWGRARMLEALCLEVSVDGGARAAEKLTACRLTIRLLMERALLIPELAELPAAQSWLSGR